MNFFESVYKAVSEIPKGKVATYGQIAAMCGAPRASRAVGMALHHNPKPIEIPCHRVVNRLGYVARCFAFGGGEAQIELLRAEGIEVSDDGRVDLDIYLLR
ncbi:MAG: MGMT family protein [Clostridiales bacterium]|nr:MGMT family protein [Clostridiales bacterium]HOB64333.1 MGMT family protein [Clostridia bacterium]HOK81542.1 MGMT family protein [Clostridia bacterium]HOL60988.1 MGMT family protein [Clostridia bacterium]HPO53420.1 MGMT family protein [Clostridia bacterium]